MILGVEAWVVAVVAVAVLAGVVVQGTVGPGLGLVGAPRRRAGGAGAGPQLQADVAWLALLLSPLLVAGLALSVRVRRRLLETPYAPAC